jgi:hypothetical protein
MYSVEHIGSFVDSVRRQVYDDIIAEYATLMLICLCFGYRKFYDCRKIYWSARGS